MASTGRRHAVLAGQPRAGRVRERVAQAGESAEAEPGAEANDRGLGDPDLAGQRLGRLERRLILVLDDPVGDPAVVRREVIELQPDLHGHIVRSRIRRRHRAGLYQRRRNGQAPSDCNNPRPGDADTARS